MFDNQIATTSVLTSAIITPANSEGLSNYKKNQKESNNLRLNEWAAEMTLINNASKPANFRAAPLSKFVQIVKNESVESQIKEIRNAKNNADKNKRKNNLPAIAFGCYTGTPSAKTYISGSRTISIADIDNVPDGKLDSYKASLSSHPSVVCCFVSPSGNGLKAFFRTPPIKDNAHSYRSWEQVNRECKKLIPNIVVDPSGKNLSRLCYFSSDPNIYVNFQAEELAEDYDQDDVVVVAVPSLSSVKEGVLVEIDPAIEDQVIATATGMCAKASKDDANRHHLRLSLGMFVGGCIAGGLIDEAKATDLADQLSDSIADNGTTTNKELKTLHDAIAKGKGSPIYSLRSDFDSFDDEWEIKLATHVYEWNKFCFSTIVGAAHRIGRWEDPESNAENRRTLSYYTSESLNKVYANTLIKIGVKIINNKEKDVYSNHFEAWYKNHKSASHTGGVVFLPSSKPIPTRDIRSKYYNTWEGYSVAPVKNEPLLSRVKYHIEKVVCDDQPELYDYLYKWMAYIFQHPDKPAGSAIVLRGLEGAGKGILGSFIQSIFGVHGIKVGNSKHLTGNFNAHLADVCFLFADEAFFSGDRQQSDVLKGLVTEATFTIERKGVDAVTQTNYLKIFMSTNSEYAVPAGKDSRRYFVTDVSPKYLKDESYFTPLVNDCASESVRSAFLYEMLNMELTGWSTSQIPESEGLRSQRYHSMDSVKKWLVDALIRGSFTGDFEDANGEYWDEKLGSDALYTHYIAWCNEAKAGEYKRLTQCLVTKYLSKVFIAARDVGGRGKRGIKFGSLSDAISTFEQYEKILIREIA
jgi:hypothetical protein